MLLPVLAPSLRFLSVHLDFVDHLVDPLNLRHTLLGNLLLVEAGQVASEEEHALFALTQDSPYGLVRAVFQTLLRCFGTDQLIPAIINHCEATI